MVSARLTAFASLQSSSALEGANKGLVEWGMLVSPLRTPCA